MFYTFSRAPLEGLYQPAKVIKISVEVNPFPERNFKILVISNFQPFRERVVGKIMGWSWKRYKFKEHRVQYHSSYMERLYKFLSKFVLFLFQYVSFHMTLGHQWADVETVPGLHELMNSGYVCHVLVLREHNFCRELMRRAQ